jgi:antitoxin YefM
MIISASKAREKLFPLIEQVNENQESVTITSINGNAVLVSESEWESILETAFLLRTEKNRKRLEAALVEIDQKKGTRVKYQKGETLEEIIKIASKQEKVRKKSTPKPKSTKAR